MNSYLDKKLVETFPNLYCDRFADMQSTCLCWGFEHGDGWYDIIYGLSEKLEKEIIKIKQENPRAEYYPRAVQVKEKYGSLRFYMSGENDEMEKWIEEAENKSAETCEICGKRGRIRGRGWYACRCIKHSIEEGYLPKEFWPRQLELLKEKYYSFRWRVSNIIEKIKGGN